MKFSFILATLNRINEVSYCIESLLSQDYQDFEIIIVDQSNDDSLAMVLEELNSCLIKYVHVSWTGLSKARNTGIRMSGGDYLCLVDDDACYDRSFLKNIEKCLEGNAHRIISGFIWNSIDDCAFVDYSKLNEGKALSVRQIVRYCPSPAIVIPSCAIEEVGFFDEEFGVGSYYGAGEETDYLLRAIRKGFEVRYCSDAVVFHPHKRAKLNDTKDSQARKNRSYSFGIGALYKKHLLKYENLAMLPPMFEQLAKALIKAVIAKGDSRAQLRAFMSGFKQYGGRGNPC